jgi:hypothetical protein
VPSPPAHALLAVWQRLSKTGERERLFAVRDGNLITGQQNFSGTETAALVARALGE